MVKLSRFHHPTRYFMKKKDKNVGGGNDMNNFNGGGDGENKKEKDPSRVQDRVQQTMKLLELENTEFNDGGITEYDDIMREETKAFVDRVCQSEETKAFIDRVCQAIRRIGREGLKDKRDLGDGDDDNNGGGGGGDDDNNGGGGGKNNKKGSDHDGDSNGDNYKSDRDSDGGGQMKGKNMDFRGKAGFGYKYGYHAGNEHEYQVGQLQCAQEVQSSEPKCLFYHSIMMS